MKLYPSIAWRTWYATLLAIFFIFFFFLSDKLPRNPNEQDGLSSAALFAEMFVALRDRDSQALESKPQPELAIRTDLPDQPGQALPLPHLEDTRDGPTKPDEDRAGNGAAVSNATAPPSPCCTTATVGAKSQSSPSTSPEDDMASALSPENEATSSPSPQNEVTSSPSPGNEGMTSSPITDHAVSCACEGERDEGQQQDQQQERLPGFSSVLVRRLQELHARYGEFAEENGYVRCDDAQVSERLRMVGARKNGPRRGRELQVQMYM